MSDLGKYPEQVIAAYSEWLNAWHKHNDGEENVVRREMYDEYGTHPEVMLDQTFNEDNIYGDRMIRVWADPYHDEGGGSMLTAWFTLTPETADRLWPEQVEWQLDFLVQEFDTDKQFIMEHGKLRLPE
jgi:hypothetical protein